jgi:hypothetical protein
MGITADMEGEVMGYAARANPVRRQVQRVSLPRIVSAHELDSVADGEIVRLNGVYALDPQTMIPTGRLHEFVVRRRSCEAK